MPLVRPEVPLVGPETLDGELMKAVRELPGLPSSPVILLVGLGRCLVLVSCQIVQ
jgi:hypothetical protein